MRRLLAAIALALVAAGAAEAKPAAKPAPTLSVLTRNLYIGTDLTPIFLAATETALLDAVATGYRNVLASNYAERAAAFAAEIARARPDVVGLQEVIMVRTQTPGDGQATPAQDVQLDFLRLIRDELARRGLRYRVVASIVSGDDELPSPLGFDVRVTDREVLLVRQGRGAPIVRRPRGARFRNTFSIVTRLGPLSLERAWVSADLTVGGRAVRVISTHLEAFAGGIQAAQGQELVRGPARTRLPVVMLGDFNSRADGTGTRTYGELRRAGFVDAWSRAHPGDPGLTCCHPSDVRSDRPFDERIDLVLFRGPLRAVSATVVGEEQADRTPSGLWPSDHAGLVSVLRFRPR